MPRDEPVSRFDQVWNHLCAMAFTTLAVGTLLQKDLGREGGDRQGISMGKANGKMLSDTIVQFHLDCGRFPTQEEGLEALRAAPVDVGGRWKGPYLEKPIPKDSYDRPFRYTPIKNGFRLRTLGADGRPGGVGLDEDQEFGCLIEWDGPKRIYTDL